MDGEHRPYKSSGQHLYGILTEPKLQMCRKVMIFSTLYEQPAHYPKTKQNLHHVLAVEEQHLVSTYHLPVNKHTYLV